MMLTTILTSNQMLLMLELCLEAEGRCDEQIASARERSDYSAAAIQVQLKEQYENMKQRIFNEMRKNGTSTQDLHAELPSLRRLLQDRA